MTTDSERSINGDLRRRASVNSAAMDWQRSPSATVWRKRLHLVGGAETGQLTSIVRYDPDSSFPAHDHPEGEEILVLEGTFSDEHGDWPAGTYLLNPEGFRHAPFSREGCVLFVKLRQYAGEGRAYVKLDENAVPWDATEQPGIEAKTLYRDPRFADVTRLERWAPGAAPGVQVREGGLEILVLEGSLEDEHGAYGPGTWLRLPDGAEHTPRSPEGCVFYAKSGGVPALRSTHDWLR